eukprot:gi/632981698/ref/XP_007907735.1/ PREDICTED: zinc finger BED domain-containing protein 4-like [Callorhinchus milii]
MPRVSEGWRFLSRLDDKPVECELCREGLCVSVGSSRLLEPHRLEMDHKEPLRISSQHRAWGSAELTCSQTLAQGGKRVSETHQERVSRLEPGEESGRQETLSLQPFVGQSSGTSAEDDLSMVLRSYSLATSLGSGMKRRKGESPIVAREGWGRSDAWEFFKRLNERCVECSICRKQLSYHSSTTSLREHLRRKHGLSGGGGIQGESSSSESVGREPERAADSPQPEPKPKLNPKHNPKPNPKPRSVERREEVITGLILGMVVHDLQPLTLVSDRGFKRLLRFLEPSYTVPTVEDLTRVLQQRYQSCKQRLEKSLRSAQSLALATHVWVSHDKHTYITVTAHFIDDGWRRAECVLRTERLLEPGAGGQGEVETGAKVRAGVGAGAGVGVRAGVRIRAGAGVGLTVGVGAREILCSVAGEFGVPLAAVICVVQETQSLREQTPHSWQGLCCAEHTLQLCIGAGLQAEGVQQALNIARGLISSFPQGVGEELGGRAEGLSRHRERDRDRDRERYKVGLVLDVPGLWNTTLDMLERLLELRWALSLALEEDRAVQKLTDTQWKLLEDLIPVLKTLKVASSFLSEPRNTSVSCLLPCLHGLASALKLQHRDSPNVMATGIRAEIHKRWRLWDQEEMMESPAVLASFLDPRFKDLRFLTSETREKVLNKVRNLVSIPAPVSSSLSLSPLPSWSSSEELSGDENNDNNNKLYLHGTFQAGSTSRAAEDKWDKRGRKPQHSDYDLLFGEDPSETLPELPQQLERYLAEPVCKRRADPLGWWRSREHRFPAVARLAKRYLAIPALSSSSSTPQAAFYTSASSPLPLPHPLPHHLSHSHHLPPELLDQILFLNKNVDYLDSSLP